MNKRDLAALYLSGIYFHRNGTRPPSYVTPRQPTIYTVVLTPIFRDKYYCVNISVSLSGQQVFNMNVDQINPLQYLSLSLAPHVSPSFPLCLPQHISLLLYLSHMLYILTSVWVLHCPNAGQNLLFQCFWCHYSLVRPLKTCFFLE